MPRRVMTVQGIVQGVGFRPFVVALADQLGLTGSVRNQGGNVVIDVEGDDPLLDRFTARLTRDAPPRATVERVTWRPAPPRGERAGAGFSIAPSQAGAAEPVAVSPDLATCDACLAELFDRSDRRFRYPFLNCTNCGPRLTVITAVPYDRPRTTMAGFDMCHDCRREYEDRTDRRYHAQPIACPACGPSLALADRFGNPVETDDPLVYAASALAAGRIGAIKGLGGYHLACDARSAVAVGELRRRKHRDAKPLAVMVRDLPSARALVRISDAEEALLTSSARPIVLLRKRPDAGVADDVAPRCPELGVMLPYAPLHHLLFEALGDLPLVMTSGNWTDEPIAYEDRDAIDRLGDLADFFLLHDRPIHVRCDDSVTRVLAGYSLPLRRSRGEAPAPIALPIDCRQPVLALGGQLKAVFALGRNRQAILSHHLGDLDYLAAQQAYVEAIDHYRRLFGIEPHLWVHDLHPDYASTRYAHEQVDASRRLGVQHHHAHLASCLADNGLDEPAIGVIFDGTGFGLDGAAWGGEFLIGSYGDCRRAAHLRYVAMPGGEAAIRQPWRMALSHLVDAGIDSAILAKTVSPASIDATRRMIDQRFNAPLTSSMGRLFDAVATLAALGDEGAGLEAGACAAYEGQAAIELEWLATGYGSGEPYPFSLQRAEKSTGEPLQIDMRPLVAGVVEDVRRGEPATAIARRFHSTVVEVVVRVTAILAEQTALDAVVLSGGVFTNALLLSETVSRLETAGLRVYRHQRVPPGDGGLCLGQLAIAAARQRRDNASADSV